MKIAIQGHLTRGKEVIQILESLGGKKLYYSDASDKYLVFFIDDKGYISCLHYESPIVKECSKVYTLEEFEKEFPFKIGDKVRDCSDNEIGIIDDLLFIDNALMYNVDFVYSGQAFMPTEQLKPYEEMKEERNITLTLDKAKEWYNKGGELKEIALQAYTKEELNPLPKSWEEYCKGYKVPVMIFGPCIPNKYVALWKLEQLRDCYRQGWKPEWNSSTSIPAIHYTNEGFSVYSLYTRTFLSFQSRRVAEEFLKNFEHLIKEAGDLI